MNNIGLTALVVLFGYTGFAQTTTKIYGKDTFIIEHPKAQPNERMILVDSLPRFAGDLQAYLNQKTKGVAITPNEQQLIRVSFTIDENGITHAPKVLNAPSKRIDSIAKRIVLDMPEWQPAVKDGRPLSSPYSINIQF